MLIEVNGIAFDVTRVLSLTINPFSGSIFALIGEGRYERIGSVPEDATNDQKLEILRKVAGFINKINQYHRLLQYSKQEFVRVAMNEDISLCDHLLQVIGRYENNIAEEISALQELFKVETK